MRIHKSTIVHSSLLAALAVSCLTGPARAGQPGKSPVKVFILAGQSNMQGQGVTGGEFTGPWGTDCKEPAAVAIRKAQAAAAARPEFQGTVTFVETHDYVRAEKDSPTGEGYHEFKNGETYFLIGNALGEGMMKLIGPKPKPSERLSMQG
jgi:hypothetical protein